MKNAKQIFNYIQRMNPATSTISSIGTLVCNLNQQVADSFVNEVIANLPEGTLAHKIATSNISRFSAKQLWVIAFELERNEQYATMVANHYADAERRYNAKIEAQEKKKAANKEASADILAPIKEMRKLGDFGKWLNTSGNPFRKQHFNKKYTSEAVNAFLATIKKSKKWQQKH